MKKSAFKNYLFSLIDAEGYDVAPPVTQKAKINFFFDTFRNEYDWNIRHMGERKALVEYLKGLPSSINIPFYNGEVIETGERFGFLRANASESRQDAFLEGWWGRVAGMLIEMHINENKPLVYKTPGEFIAAYNDTVGGPMFDRATMRFFGDTVKNFKLINCSIEIEGVPTDVYILERRKSTKLPAGTGYFFRMDNLKRIHGVN